MSSVLINDLILHSDNNNKQFKNMKTLFSFFVGFAVLMLLSMITRDVNLFIVSCTAADITGVVLIVKHWRSGNASLF